MKVILLAGGFGARLSEETNLKPKPMIEIGGRPILWHIMKIYSHHGFNEFIICLGYRGYVIKEYFANYCLHQSNFTVDMEKNELKIHERKAEAWKVTLVDTGLDTMTGGRIRKAQNHIGDETFMLTYGDGVGDVNIGELLRFHKEHGKLATITAVQPSGRFGALNLDDKNSVLSFQEKPNGDGAWINGGFFVLEPKVFEYISSDDTVWERDPLERLARDGQLVANRHHGFWQPMDTLRDKNYLEELWMSEKAPWRVWE